MTTMQPKFELGRCLVTPAAQEAVSQVRVLECLERHRSGDWGEVSDDDWAENELSLREGYRLLSSYTIDDDRSAAHFWIITEADRSTTTVLLPSDY
jgi:hypothetical protein